MFHNLRKNYRGGLPPRSPDASKFFSPLPGFSPSPFPTLPLAVLVYPSSYKLKNDFNVNPNLASKIAKIRSVSTGRSMPIWQ